jgi:hypothetical protein
VQDANRSRIGGGAIAKQDALPGETVVWSAKANRAQGRRVVGGRLYLTDERLLFNPHVVDAVTGGRRWAVDLRDIAAVGTRPGKLRDRLRIELRDGRAEHFLVNGLDDVVARLHRATASTAETAPS